VASQTQSIQMQHIVKATTYLAQLRFDCNCLFISALLYQPSFFFFFFWFLQIPLGGGKIRFGFIFLFTDRRTKNKSTHRFFFSGNYFGFKVNGTVLTSTPTIMVRIQYLFCQVLNISRKQGIVISSNSVSSIYIGTGDVIYYSSNENDNC